jgi:cell division protein FtsB
LWIPILDYICSVKLKTNQMTLSLSQETYTQAVMAQQAQIQALQSRVMELEAKVEVLQRSIDTSLFI